MEKLQEDTRSTGKKYEELQKIIEDFNNKFNKLQNNN